MSIGGNSTLGKEPHMNEQIRETGYAPKGARRPEGTRILAQGCEVPNDTWQTRLNNNDLIVGPTGSGKTRYYVKPNLLQMNESVIVTDTKGSLRHEVGPVLKDAGYDIIDISFAAMDGTHGYNPFDFIRCDERTGAPSQRDIMTVASALVPTETLSDPYWDQAAKNLASCYIGYIMEGTSEEDRTVSAIAELLAYSRPRESANDPLGATETLLSRFSEEHPNSFTATKWRPFQAMTAVARTYGCILGMLSEKIDPFTFSDAIGMMTMPDRIDFKSLGQRKTAVFLTVSDTDRSLDRLVSLFYTQALQELCRFADRECPGHALPVPVRLYLDDFATNCRIPDFDKTISVIRSRNISASVVLQSITQLETLYDRPAALTIVNGCDHMLYLGGQDLDTADMISKKGNKTLETILDMKADEAWLFESKAPARKVKRYELKEHRRYALLPEAKEGVFEDFEPRGAVEDQLGI